MELLVNELYHTRAITTDSFNHRTIKKPQCSTIESLFLYQFSLGFSVLTGKSFS
jgi:hypothetical protein